MRGWEISASFSFVREGGGLEKAGTNMRVSKQKSP